MQNAMQATHAGLAMPKLANTKIFLINLLVFMMIDVWLIFSYT